MVSKISKPNEMKMPKTIEMPPDKVNKLMEDLRKTNELREAGVCGVRDITQVFPQLKEVNLLK